MPSPLAQHWTLDPSIDFLNHGSFGACPRPVLDAQSELRARMERQPVQFFVRDLEKLLDEARGELGAFVGADPDDLAFVPNATTGVNTVVRSLDLNAGDELLTTDHAYNACRNALRWHEHRGVKVVMVRVPWPCEGPHQVIDAVMNGVTARTKLALIDHVTSPTGLIFPVGELVRRLGERGIDTLVDGAHAPGMLPLDVRAIGAAYYTGNCHKWLCAPKGAAFLHVRRDRQDLVKPIAHGHGLNSPRTDRSRFRLQMDFIATDDFTPFLCVPHAIRFFGSLMPWPELMARNHALALRGRDLVEQALGTRRAAPDFMLGSLAPVLLPEDAPPAWAVQRALLDKHRIEVPVFPFPAAPKALIRLSAQLYNDEQQFAHLARVLPGETRPPPPA
jgi:isopenicillin-N epimerase